MHQRCWRRRRLAQHLAEVERLEAELAAAHRIMERTEAANSKHTAELGAEKRRADAALADTMALRSQLAEAQHTARSARAELVRDMMAATERARASEAAREHAEARLVNALKGRDALQRQVEELLAGSQSAELLPIAPTGELRP